MDSILSRIPAWPGTAALTDAIRDPKGLFVMLAVVVLVLYGLSVGRTRALVSLLSIYVAYMLAVLFPFLPWIAKKLPESSRSMGAVGLFIVLYALTFIILSRSMLKGRLTLGEISLWQVLVISVVQIGLLASICVSLVPLERGQQLLGPMHRWFGGQYPLWAWAVASLLIMPFMRSRRSRE
ncbi:MAG: hypothetical protein AAB375_00080 [Patescibacteria group bacterium]